jgi:hypothetical protein
VIGYACLSVGAVPFSIGGISRIEGLDVLCLSGGGLLMILGATLRYAGEPPLGDARKIFGLLFLFASIVFLANLLFRNYSFWWLALCYLCLFNGFSVLLRSAKDLGGRRRSQ